MASYASLPHADTCVSILLTAILICVLCVLQLGHPNGLVRILAKHYVKEGVKQLYKIFGSLEVLGNPVNVGSERGRGVKSFFYEPAQGALVSPEAFATGMATGSMSLIKHSVAGLGTAVGAISNSAGKAAAALSMDPDFVARNVQVNQSDPEHVGQGVSSGTKQLVTGIKEGLKGVVMDPIRGNRAHGAKGLAKGIVTGVVGLFAKPASGVLSLVSQTAKGIANTGDYLSDGPKVRAKHFRPKRVINASDPRVKVYDAREAELAQEDDKLSAGEEARGRERQLQQFESSTQIRDNVADRGTSNQAMTASLQKDNDREAVKHTDVRNM